MQVRQLAANEGKKLIDNAELVISGSFIHFQDSTIVMLVHASPLQSHPGLPDAAAVFMFHSFPTGTSVAHLYAETSSILHPLSVHSSCADSMQLREEIDELQRQTRARSDAAFDHVLVRHLLQLPVYLGCLDILNHIQSSLHLQEDFNTKGIRPVDPLVVIVVVDGVERGELSS